MMSKPAHGESSLARIIAISASTAPPKTSEIATKEATYTAGVPEPTSAATLGGAWTASQGGGKPIDGSDPHEHDAAEKQQKRTG